jgi:hypothetical protein
LTPAHYDAIARTINADPRYAPLDGSKFKGGRILFQSFRDREAGKPFSGLEDAEYWARLGEMLPTRCRTPLETDIYEGTFGKRYHHGPRAFLRIVGRRADALRRVASLFADRVQPLFEAVARELGADEARFRRWVDAHRDALTHAAKHLEQVTERLAAVQPAKADRARSVLEAHQAAGRRYRCRCRRRPLSGGPPWRPQLDAGGLP